MVGPLRLLEPDRPLRRPTISSPSCEQLLAHRDAVHLVPFIEPRSTTAEAVAGCGRTSAWRRDTWDRRG